MVYKFLPVTSTLRVKNENVLHVCYYYKICMQKLTKSKAERSPKLSYVLTVIILLDLVSV